MARQTKLDRLLESEELLALEHLLGCLENKMARMADLNGDDLELDNGTRLVLLSQAEAALGELRWQLHSEVRRFIWLLKKL